MNTVKHRYSAEIQRTRGLLELAAALYDTSLSFQTERAAEQAIQTESRVGYSLTLALTATREKGVSFSFAADGFRELLAVSRGKLSLGWINPSVAATMCLMSDTDKKSIAHTIVSGHSPLIIDVC